MNSQSEPERSLAELVKHVFKHSSDSLEGITYQELAGRIDRLNKHGIGHGHGMGDVLGKMGHLLQDLSGEWGESIPHIQSLVVQKTGGLKGLPDDGIQVDRKSTRLNSSHALISYAVFCLKKKRKKHKKNTWEIT